MKMIRCKEAMKGADCGKTICCKFCDNVNDCEMACMEAPETCSDAISEENALAVMKKDAAAVIKAVADLAVAKKKIEDQEKAMRTALLEAMEKYGVEKFDNELVKFTYVKATTRTSIDSTKLKKDLPDVAAKYSKTSNVSASVRIEVK